MRFSTVDITNLQNANDYAYKSQELRNVWSRNAGCAGLQDQLEYSYAFEMGYLFTNQQPDGERYFYHSDHLGSSAYITTENGYATQFLAYQPFGETLAEQQNSTGYYSPFKFSAKEKDPETGYSYFGARYYSPELSVWLSVDPMSDERPSLSPYNYCQWNPVMLVDPTGMLDEEVNSDRWESSSEQTKKFLSDHNFHAYAGEPQTGEDDKKKGVTKSGAARQLFYQIPVIGPTQESADLLSEGDYVGATGAFGWAVLDVLLIGRASSIRLGGKYIQTAKNVGNVMPEGNLANHLFKGAGKLADNPANRRLIQNISNGKPLVVDKFGKSWYRGVDAGGNGIYSYTQNGVVKGAGYTNFNAKQLINHIITTVGIK